MYPSPAGPDEKLPPLISAKFDRFEALQRHLFRVGSSVLAGLEAALGLEAGEFTAAHTYAAPSEGDTMFLKYPRATLDEGSRGGVRMAR